MTITREEMIKKLSDKSGYYQKDIRVLLQCLDEIVFEELSSVTDDEEVSIQLVSGIKVITTFVRKFFNHFFACNSHNLFSFSYIFLFW